MKDHIKVRSSKLDLIIDDEYLHCTVKDKIKFEIRIKLIFDVIKYVYNKIQEEKKN